MLCGQTLRRGSTVYAPFIISKLHEGPPDIQSPLPPKPWPRVSRGGSYRGFVAPEGSGGGRVIVHPRGCVARGRAGPPPRPPRPCVRLVPGPRHRAAVGFTETARARDTAAPAAVRGGGVRRASLRPSRPGVPLRPHPTGEPARGEVRACTGRARRWGAEVTLWGAGIPATLLPPQAAPERRSPRRRVRVKGTPWSRSVSLGWRLRDHKPRCLPGEGAHPWRLDACQAISDRDRRGDWKCTRVPRTG